jgi:FKBP-type peptidyl-prolyl cis-trans isomerase
MKHVAGAGVVLCALAFFAPGCSNDENKPVELEPVTESVRTVEPAAQGSPTVIMGTPTPLSPAPTAAPNKGNGQNKPSGQGKKGAPTKSVNKLIIQDIKKGTGAEAKTGDSVTVNYRGTLTNGQQFDTSYGREPFTFSLGAGQVIKGWDQGVAGMKVGGKRKLTVPADLAYGAASPSPLIPPNSTLVFDVELLDVKKP